MEIRYGFSRYSHPVLERARVAGVPLVDVARACGITRSWASQIARRNLRTSPGVTAKLDEFAAKLEELEEKERTDQKRTE
jgi:hypothetical protein